MEYLKNRYLDPEPLCTYNWLPCELFDGSHDEYDKIVKASIEDGVCRPLIWDCVYEHWLHPFSRNLYFNVWQCFDMFYCEQVSLIEQNSEKCPNSNLQINHSYKYF